MHRACEPAVLQPGLPSVCVLPNLPLRLRFLPPSLPPVLPFLSSCIPTFLPVSFIQLFCASYTAFCFGVLMPLYVCTCPHSIFWSNLVTHAELALTKMVFAVTLLRSLKSGKFATIWDAITEFFSFDKFVHMYCLFAACFLLFQVPHWIIQCWWFNESNTPLPWYTHFCACSADDGHIRSCQ